MKQFNWIWIIAILAACTSGTAQKAEITKVSSEELANLLTQPDVQLVDVRTPQEVAQGYIAGARHINIADPSFQDKISKLDKEKPVVVYCAVGGRSAQAASQLKALGFTQIYDANGGTREWVKLGFPLKKPE